VTALALGQVSNPQAQRLGLRGQTGAVDCSKSIISLVFFEYFLLQDKKYCGLGVQPQLSHTDNKKY
jgi:hypothetical protein